MPSLGGGVGEEGGAGARETGCRSRRAEQVTSAVGTAATRLRPRMPTLSPNSDLLVHSPMPDVLFFRCLRNSLVLNLERDRERMWREYIALSVLACANNNS